MESNKHEKIKRLMLVSGLTLVIGSGIALQVVKVPTEKEVTITINSTIETKETENGMSTFYTYEVPEGYFLKFDEKGNPIGYKMIETEVTLNDYLESKYKTR